MIGFAGLSHLGIVSSVATASKGFPVVACDADAKLCENLASGRLPILEPGLPELLAGCRDHIRFTADFMVLNACDVVYVSLDVPTDRDNSSDLSGLRQLIDSVSPRLKAGATLVMLSQVPPGFTRRLRTELQPILQERGVQLCSQVETLIFGSAVQRALHPERFIVGCADPHAVLPKAYADLLAAFGCPILQMRYESAELAKISINVFLAASISTTNTVAELCEAVGADWMEIASALRLDQRIGPHAYLIPGLGIAGGNIERDLVTIQGLAARYGTDDGVPAAFNAHSRYRRDWVLKILQRQVLSKQHHPVIAVWGLAYKPNTKSTKNSPTWALLDALRSLPIQLYDPEVTLPEGYPNVAQKPSALEACRGAHALVIMTAWEEFASLSAREVKQVMVRPVVIDPSAVWSGRDVAAEGVTYSTLGRSPV